MPVDAPPAPPGVAEWLRPGKDGGLRRVLAPNPSPMTGRGTNSYIVGTGSVALIDPGPDDDRHLAALLAALDPGERISHIFVTHAHRDHSALAPRLAAATGAPVLAFGDATAGRSELMEDLARREAPTGGEGADRAFRPDRLVADGDQVAGGDWSLTALHTPGHFGNHLCLDWQGEVFSGDHVMGWSTSIVAPPDGDMGAYMRSLDRLAAARPARLWPGHGDPVLAPLARIAELTLHRQARARAITEALREGPATPLNLARQIYTDTPTALLGAAALNTFAHLIELSEKNEAIAEGDLRFSARFRLT
ncbi:MBL fold metallo-hydrolase [Frigidibacter sp. SD6-1]|uniref:MBL fold metallo-hydrolase n=1 Tax=Frigidibacter sp. SD6-1 TaxID=3032581 RepID=UPI0024DFE951|nr:MBL fold metallo-hydrolase [Frigidibacter sp. SD6-1]